MENKFYVDSQYLSPAALEKKHRLENDPSSRKNHMEYLPGMEIIESEVCRQVMSQMQAYDFSTYTARDVRAALEHDACTIEDLKALLSPAAEPFLEELFETYQEVFGSSRNAMFRMKENWHLLLYRFEGSEKLGKRLRKTTDVTEYKSIVHDILHTLPLAPELQADW